MSYNTDIHFGICLCHNQFYRISQRQGQDLYQIECEMSKKKKKKFLLIINVSIARGVQVVRHITAPSYRQVQYWLQFKHFSSEFLLLSAILHLQ